MTEKEKPWNAQCLVVDDGSIPVSVSVNLRDLSPLTTEEQNKKIEKMFDNAKNFLASLSGNKYDF